MYDPPSAWTVKTGQNGQDLFNSTTHSTGTYNASLAFSFYGVRRNEMSALTLQTAVFYYGNGGSDHGPASIFLASRSEHELGLTVQDDNIVATPSSYFNNGEPILLWAATNLSLDVQARRH